MKAGCESLIEVLEDAKRLVALSGNDFDWSGWLDRDEALTEINEYIERVKVGDKSKQLDMRVLFAPTGPLQELSLSSGWADEFLKLASRFDAAENT